MKPSFEKTVDVLVKAYLNNTLQHEECEACAVGNIVGGMEWRYVFCTTGRLQVFYDLHKLNHDFGHSMSSEQLNFLRKKGLKLINDSGYTIADLARVEYAFESTPHDGPKDHRMFNGLMAVVDVLAEIHGIDLEKKESAKLLFVKV